MNETEIAKQIVLQTFSQKSFPNSGLIEHFSERSEIVMRGYLLKAAGVSFENDNKHSGQTPKSKKTVLVTVYKVWSAFSKGLRHTLNSKTAPVALPRIGTFYNSKRG